MVRNGQKNEWIIDKWDIFLDGYWTKQKPTVAGVYPIHGNMDVDNPQPVFGRPEQCMTILPDGRMFGNTWIEERGGWWWSEPMPILPVEIPNEPKEQ